MKCISFGKIDKKLLIPVIGGIITLILTTLVSKNKKYNVLRKNPLILDIYVAIGMISSFIPYLIIKYRTRKLSLTSDELSEKSKLNIILIYHNYIKETRFTKYKLIFCSAIIDFSASIIIYAFCSYFNYSLWTSEILFMSLFSHLILKTKLYKHQYFSMIIIIVLGLIMNIIHYFNFSESQRKFKFLDLILKLISEICASLNAVIVKYNMEKTYSSPYEVCLWLGFVELIFYIIILVIFNLLRLKIAGVQYPDNFFELFGNYDINDFLLCFILLIVNACYNIALYVTNDYFTPFHTMIIDILNELYSYSTIGGDKIISILGIIIVTLIGIMFLIFVEIIELNLCKLSHNTKKNIEIRALRDSFVGEYYIPTSGEEVLKNEEDEEEL